MDIHHEYQKNIARSLKWLAFSVRPLSVEEVAEIFILDPQSPVPFNEDERLFKLDDVLLYLSSFVTASVVRFCENSGIRHGKEMLQITLAHFSIKEFLLSDRMDPKIANTFSLKEAVEGNCIQVDSALAGDASEGA